MIIQKYAVIALTPVALLVMGVLSTYSGNQQDLGNSAQFSNTASINLSEVVGVENRYGGGTDLDTFLLLPSGTTVPEGYAAYDDGKHVRVNAGLAANRLLPGRI